MSVRDMTVEQRQVLTKIALQFPASNGIYEWAEHFEQNPGSFVLNEYNAPVVAWLLVQLWAGDGPPIVPEWRG